MSPKLPTLGPPDSPRRLHLFYLFAATIIVRSLMPVWRSPDSYVFLDLAESIKQGSFARDGILTTGRPPLYPWLLVAGEDTVLVLQLILGALTVVLVYLIAKHWLPAVIVLVHPLINYYSNAVLTETLYVFLIVACCYLWSEKKWGWAGIVFGLSFLCRQTTFPMLLAVVALYPFAREKGLLKMVAIAFLVAAPWIVRNSIVEGRPTMVQSNTDVQLLAGTFDGGWEVTEWIGQYKGRERQAAIDRYVNEPGTVLAARMRQYPELFIDSGEYLGDGRPLQFDPPMIQVLRRSIFWFCIMFYILALWGVRKCPPHIWLVPLVLAVVHLPLWIEIRYFLPAIPLLAISAGATASAIWKRGSLRQIAVETAHGE